MAYRKALKDLGVAQGLGKEARVGAAKRHATLQQRSEAISILAVPAAKSERLVAISGIPAGLYGAAARPPDADTLACMRRWVMHACDQGSRFVQSALWFVLCAASWRSDPVKVWLIKAAEACGEAGEYSWRRPCSTRLGRERKAGPGGRVAGSAPGVRD